MKNYKIFPDFDLERSNSMLENHIILSAKTYVRVKKGGKYYLVAIHDYHKADLTSRDLESQYSSFVKNFVSNCINIEYLWLLPDTATKNKMIREGSLIVDHMDLTNKELFLLNKRI